MSSHKSLFDDGRGRRKPKQLILAFSKDDMDSGGEGSNVPQDVLVHQQVGVPS